MGFFFFATASKPDLGPTLLSSGYRGAKQPGHETDHSPLSSAEIKNAWSYTSTPPTRLRGVGQLYVLLQYIDRP
jgi:hypothetical protein